MELTKVSIIVPVYNVEIYLDKCIESLIHQTLTDIEILLVDDGSTDNSFSICQHYSSVDHRVHVFRKNNGGLSSARNYGIDRAKGEYLLFVDSDDYIEYSTCEELIRYTDKADVVIYGVIKEGNENSRFPQTPMKGIYSSDDLLEMLLLGKKVKSWAVNKLIKRELLADFRFNESIRYQEDVEFFIRFFSQVKCNVCFIDEYFYHYVIRSNSLTGALNNRFNSYRIIEQTVYKLDESIGKKYRTATIYMNECRVCAILKLKERDVIRRNRKYLKYNFRLLANTLKRSDKIRISLIVLNYDFYAFIERNNYFAKMKRGQYIQ